MVNSDNESIPEWDKVIYPKGSIHSPEIDTDFGLKKNKSTSVKKISLTDELAKVTEQNAILLNAVQFYANECDDDEGLEARSALACIKELASCTDSPDAGK